MEGSNWPKWFEEQPDNPEIQRRYAEQLKTEGKSRQACELYCKAAVGGDRLAGLQVLQYIWDGLIPSAQLGKWIDAGAEEGRSIPLVAWAMEMIANVERDPSSVEDLDEFRRRLASVVVDVKKTEDSQALFLLGKALMGHDRLLDPELAFECYHAAALLGSMDAVGEVALGILDGFWVKDQREVAINFLHKAAAAGSCSSAYRLAQCYDEGIGVEKDPQKAFQLLNQAADGGYVPAYFALGWNYDLGIGVKVNHYEAVRLYGMGAEAGHLPSMYALAMAHLSGDGCSKSTDLAIDWFERAAQGGHAPAYLRLADLCSSWADQYGLEKDERKAFSLVKQAAQLGDLQAMERLAFAYEQGRGCDQDLLLAHAWALRCQQQAQKQGDAQS